ncbi:MAG: hypothetical protein PHR77_05595 [Kiritimatiellae bacterium]|nr:hypothetical protein [Kiritimatiellia bacterium]MDD5519183.1 hypothetical protein [Kiritimatiellia bacterium]
MSQLILHVKLFLLVMSLFILTGCATGQDTDMPWNTPQPWEGSPTIPGLPTYQ